ncbi:MAG TPA: outer membrane beta-barrel family protein [Ferruginibacter sp.]|nr:outer membrane beta-barrel family protein [Ferruginibacter sp.]
MYTKAQFPMGGGMSRQNMDIGHVYGKIIDGSTQKVLEGASVQLLQSKLDSASKKRKEVSIALTLTNKKGEFSIEKLSVMGTYTLRVTAVGFKKLDQKVNFNINFQGMRNGDFSSLMNGVDKDLGNIKLEKDEQQLENVTITASKPLLQLNLDKKTYNVEKDLMATGGTALDVMKNIPSVNVDIDGNVSLRNAAPQIFLDGRPTTLTPDQIPADQIASIEIISNPSAKYDAGGGGAGILNIVLKKNRKTGYNGNLRANIDSRPRPGFGGDINIRKEKINFFAAGFLGFRKTLLDVESRRKEFLANGLISNQIQENNPIGRGGFGFGRAGMDIFIDNRSTISISGNIGRGRFRNLDQISLYRDTIAATGIVAESGIRNLSAKTDFRNYGASIGFKHNFSKPGKEWTIDLNINQSKNENISSYDGQFFDAANTPKSPVVYERSDGGGRSTFITAQTDFVSPLDDKRKMEAGLRMASRKFNSFNNNFIGLDPSNLVFLPQLFVQYSFTDEVYAGYLTYSEKRDKWSYQLGARVESSFYTGTLESKNQSFSNDFPFAFFPSAFLTYSINKKQDLQVNYTRKVNRPNFFNLIPFIDFSDSLNLSIGNPALKPEFTHQVELTYNRQLKNGQSFLATAYGRLTNNLITRYQYRDKNPNPAKTDSVLFTTYGNATRSITYGLELTARNKITKWWDLTSNINLYQINLEANNLTGTDNSNLGSFFAKINNSFRLPKSYSIQLNAEYQAKTLLPSGNAGNRGFGGPFGQIPVTAQGYIKPFFGVDIAVRKDFLKNNAASLTLQFSDVFRSRYNSTFASSIFFEQDYERIRDPQIFRLSFNWRFGKLDASLFKRKNIKGEMENMQNMQQGVGQ